MKCAWLILGALCWTTGCVAETDSTGGKTNWVTCNTNDDCAELPGTSCVKKVCVTPADGGAEMSNATSSEDARVPAPESGDSEPTTPDAAPDSSASRNDGSADDPATPIEASTETDGPSTEPTTDEGECFSPTQNVEQVYACSLPGCACNTPNDAASLCVEAGSGNRYALHCTDGHWEPADNRRCATDSELCFSPTENVDLAASGTLNGCECPESCLEETCETCGGEPGAHLPMVCSDGRWQVASLIDCEGLAQDLCSGLVFEENCYSPTQNQDSALEQGAQGCDCFAGIEQPDCVSDTLFTCDDAQWSAEATTCPGADLDSGPAPGPLPNAFEPSPAAFTLILTPTWADADAPDDTQVLFSADFTDSITAWVSSAGEQDASDTPSGYTARSTEAEYSLSGQRLEFEPFTVAATEGGYSFSGFSLQRDSDGLIEGTASGTWIPTSAAADGVRPFTATVVAFVDEQAPHVAIVDPGTTIERNTAFRIASSEPLWTPELDNVTVLGSEGPLPFALRPVEDVRPGFVTEFQIVSEDDGWPLGEELEVRVHALRDAAGNATEDPLSLGQRLVVGDASP